MYMKNVANRLCSEWMKNGLIPQRKHFKQGLKFNKFNIR